MVTLKPLWGYLVYNNISLKTLAEKSGVSYMTLAKMKREDIFSAPTLDKICTTLNLNISQIMRYDPD